MRVICTAGHVDHGKSTLVHALTGINPDRLREEIERAMTIDLGFAWLTLPDGETVGVVDVPGHEDFIENMLAGMGGVDAFLLIVAADEGIMPQTREHLAILELMGMPAGVVALTKIDMAESPEWIELVELDVLELLSKTPFASAPVVRVSAHTGEGLDQLLEVLAGILEQQPPRRDLGRPVLPIDRVFTLSGFGTVVTGTLSNGSLEVGQVVEIQSAGILARIRGLQSHNQTLESVGAGGRTAVNLSGVDKSEVKRGEVLSLPGLIKPTLLFDAVIDVLPDAQRPLKHNALVKVFVGPSEALATVRLLSADALKPGERGYAQLQLETTLPIQNQARFVLRIPSPPETIGGGIVLESAPGQKWKRNLPEVLERFEALAYGDPAQRLAFELKAKRIPQPISHFPDSDLLEAARQQYGLVEVEGHIAHPDALNQLAERARHILTDFHDANPLLTGMDAAELLRRLRLAETDTIALKGLAQIGVLEFDRLVRLPDRGMVFTKAQRRAIDDLLAEFDANPFAPPSYKDALGKVDEKVLKALLAGGELVFIRPDVLLRPSAYRQMVEYARAGLEGGDTLTVIALRDHFNTTRRVALPFLDHLEAKGITKRKDEGHVLKASKWESLF